MDNQTIGIITLLRSALKNEQGTLPEGFDWNQAVPVLCQHHLVAMAVRGATRCNVSRTEPAIQQLTALFCKNVADSRLQMRQLEVVYSLFRHNGIEYVPLKGAVLKPLYPQSELRLMGDADILIRNEQYPAIREILSALGLQEDGESDHEHNWHGGEFKLELHKRLVPSENKDYYAYYGDGWHLARREEQSSAYHLSPEDHYIYLLVHFAKHYRNGSVSAKNVCDFWVYRKAYPHMDEAYISGELEKLKLLEFYRNILALLDVWFEGAATTNAVEMITQTVFQGGIYSYEKAQQTVFMITSTKEGMSFSQSKRKWFLHMVFPPVQIMAQKYPILKKHPVLLPFFWVVRWFTVLFYRPDRFRRGIAAGRQVVHTDTSQIADYETKLRVVGLDFNFPE